MSKRRNRGGIRAADLPKWEARLAKAVDAVRSGKLSQEKASRNYRISASVIKRELDKCRAAEQDQ